MAEAFTRLETSPEAFPVLLSRLRACWNGDSHTRFLPHRRRSGHRLPRLHAARDHRREIEPVAGCCQLRFRTAKMKRASPYSYWHVRAQRRRCGRGARPRRSLHAKPAGGRTARSRRSSVGWATGAALQAKIAASRKSQPPRARGGRLDRRRRARDGNGSGSRARTFVASRTRASTTCSSAALGRTVVLLDLSLCRDKTGMRMEDRQPDSLLSVWMRIAQILRWRADEGPEADLTGAEPWGRERVQAPCAASQNR